jgi:DNA repair exonuclease SbcCD nuclease subunit
MDTFIRTDVNRVILISDIHLGIRNASFEWIENMTKYFDNFFIPLIRKYKEAGDKCVVIVAGDYFDNRQHIDINVMNVGAEIMQKIAAEVEVFVSIGNHDIYKKKEVDISSVKIFKLFKNVKLIEKLTTLVTSQDRKFLIVPWVGDAKEETKILTRNKNVDFYILHSDIAGFKYDNGRQIVNGVNISTIEGKKIYSGHIHKRQSTDVATYIGSPYHLKRSDIGNTKGIYSVVISPDGVKEEFVENTYSPKYLKVPLEDILDYTLDKVKKIVYNNYVDIIIKRKWKNDISMSKLMEAMDYCKPRKIEIILDKLETEFTDDNNIVTKDMSIEDVSNDKIDKLGKERGYTEEDIKKLKEMNAAYLGMAADLIGNVDNMK